MQLLGESQDWGAGERSQGGNETKEKCRPQEDACLTSGVTVPKDCHEPSLERCLYRCGWHFDHEDVEHPQDEEVSIHARPSDLPQTAIQGLQASDKDQGQDSWRDTSTRADP